MKTKKAELIHTRIEHTLDAECDKCEGVCTQMKPQHTHSEQCTTKNCKELERQAIDRAKNYGHMVDLDSIHVPVGLHYEISDYVKIGKLFADTYWQLVNGQ